MNAKKIREVLDEDPEDKLTPVRKIADSIKTLAFPFLISIVIFFLIKEDGRLDKVDIINNNVNDLKIEMTSLRDEVRKQRDSILGAEKAHLLELRLELEQSGVHIKFESETPVSNKNSIDFNNYTPIAALPEGHYFKKQKLLLFYNP